MTDQLSSATNGSVLLSSGLSSHVMAKQVIGFLELKDILNCLAVEGLKTHFHLEKYYCEEHGSKLESQVERRQEHIEEQDVEDKDNGGVTNNDADKGTVECEDCVEREFGYDRCPECNTFAHEEEIDCCNSCKGKCCHYCDKLEMGFCEGCNSNYCRVKFCPLVEYCDGCDSCWCVDCKKISWCQKCDEELGCSDCAIGHSFSCGRCESTFCFDCKDAYRCKTCSETFCRQCKKSFWCGACKERHCWEHYGDPYQCDECDKTICAKTKLFQCAECETVTCVDCSKVYACPCCTKEICADCQDVFQKCCCEGKEKFTLKASKD